MALRPRPIDRSDHPDNSGDGDAESADARHATHLSHQRVRCSHGKNDATDVVAGFDAAVSVGDLFERDHGVDERAQGVLGDELP
jgi:hypothetical protein